MLSLWFFLCFFSFLVVALFLARAGGVELLRPGITSIFVWGFIGFAYLGIYILFFKIDPYQVNIGVVNQYTVLNLWLYSSLSLVLVIAGFIICRHLFGLKIEKNQILGVPPVSTNLIIISLTGISALVLFQYIRTIGTVPLLEALTGASASELTAIRSRATNGFGGKYHWYELFFSSILTFLSYIQFARMLTQRTRANMLLFFVLFLLTSFAALMNIEKAPVVWYFIGLVIVWMVKRDTKITAKALVYMALVIVPLLAVMYIGFMGLGGRSLTSVLSAILSRATTGSISPAYFYLEMFPQHQDYLLGRSFPNPRSVFPWDPYPLTVEVMNFINPGLREAGVVGSAPTVFWAEMYANFSVWGIILSSVFVGIVLYLLQYLFSRMAMTPITVGLQTWLALKLVRITETNLSQFLFSIDIIAIVSVTILFYICDDLLRKGKNTQSLYPRV